jgi:hypothetical protein
MLVRDVLEQYQWNSTIDNDRKIFRFTFSCRHHHHRRRRHRYCCYSFLFFAFLSESCARRVHAFLELLDLLLS